MKKLQKIDFAQCDALSKEQQNSIRGGNEKKMDTRTHSDVIACITDCGDGDIAYKITWDCGGTSEGGGML